MKRINAIKLTLTTIVLLSGCINHTAKPSFEGDLTGKWSWSIDQCASSPYLISFKNKGLEMYFHARQSPYSADAPQLEPTTFSYEILGSSNQSLIAAPKTDDEREYSDSGELITWEIRIINENSFCWNRSDWGNNACTKPMQKCM